MTLSQPTAAQHQQPNNPTRPTRSWRHCRWTSGAAANRALLLKYRRGPQRPHAVAGWLPHRRLQPNIPLDKQRGLACTSSEESPCTPSQTTPQRPHDRPWDFYRGTFLPLTSARRKKIRNPRQALVVETESKHFLSSPACLLPDHPGIRDPTAARLCHMPRLLNRLASIRVVESKSNSPCARGTYVRPTRATRLQEARLAARRDRRCEDGRADD